MVLGGGYSSRDSILVLLIALITQYFLIDFSTAFCEAAHLPLFSILQGFYEVMASCYCFLSVYVVVNSLAFALCSFLYYTL